MAQRAPDNAFAESPRDLVPNAASMSSGPASWSGSTASMSGGCAAPRARSGSSPRSTSPRRSPGPSSWSASTAPRPLARPRNSPGGSSPSPRATSTPPRCASTPSRSGARPRGRCRCSASAERPSTPGSSRSAARRWARPLRLRRHARRRARQLVRAVATAALAGTRARSRRRIVARSPRLIVAADPRGYDPRGPLRAKCCGCTEAFQASRAGSIPVARLRDSHGEWRSLVAHPAGGRAVAGSNPVSPTRKSPGNGAFLLASAVIVRP